MPDSNSCSNLPKHVVSEESCQFFIANNDIRSNPASFIPILESRKKEIEDTDAIKIEATYIQVSPLNADEKTYDNLIKYDRAIAALKRAPMMERLVWSDALFLSADAHCK
jgi:hypothetical protein